VAPTEPTAIIATMDDFSSIVSTVISAGALGVAGLSFRRSGRALRIAEDEYRQRLLDRQARPELGLKIHASNQVLDANGYIHTQAQLTYVYLDIAITNSGKAAGQTRIEVWVPEPAAQKTLQWIDDAGNAMEKESGRVPDRSVRLPVGDGRQFDTRRMTRNLREVPQIGRLLHLRVPCPMAVPGEGMIPIRVRVQTDGSEAADTTHEIRLLRTETSEES